MLISLPIKADIRELYLDRKICIMEFNIENNKNMYEEKRINSPLLEKLIKFLKKNPLFIKFSVIEFKKNAADERYRELDIEDINIINKTKNILNLFFLPTSFQILKII